MTAQEPEETHTAQPRLPRTLYELSTSAGRSLDPGEVVKLVAEHAGELLHGDAVALYLWDEAAGLLMPVYTNDTRQPLEDQPLRAGQGAAGQAVFRRETVIVDDYDHYPHAVAWGLARRLKAVEAVPLLLGERPVGALVVRFYSERHKLGADEDRMLKLLAAQAAPALEAARLYATTSLQREHERALREITQALAENLDERHVLDLAVRYSAQLFKAPYARIWLLEPNGELSCAAAEGFVHSETFKRRLSADSTTGRVAAQQLVNLANAPTESTWLFNREFGPRTGLGAYLGAGLWRAGESLGVLEVMRHAGHRFGDVEEQLLISLANAVAVAVSNARTHAAVERLAREAEQRAELVAESERVLRAVYAAIGSGVLVFDVDGMIVHANAAAEEIMGQTADTLLGSRSTEAQLTIREDGSVLPVDERPVAVATRTRAAQRKVVMGITRPDGKQRWVQTNAVPLFGPDGALTRVVASFIDITDQKRNEEALRRRDAILEAVAFAAEKLLTAPEWEQSIDDVLAQLGAATAVSRVYIVPTGQEGSEAGSVSMHQWTAPGVPPRAAVACNRSYLEDLGLARWEDVLRGGGSVEGPLRSFPANEQVGLAAQSVRSLVTVPIFVGSAWWGFIGFDDCHEERTWPGSAVEVLKTAAGTLGAAILRRRAEAERLQLVREQSARVEAEAAKRRLGFLADASQILAASLDYENSLQGVANLMVPELADVCFVDVLETDGSVRRITSALVADVDVASEPGVAELIDAVMRSGQSLLEPGRIAVPLLTRAGVAGTLTWLGSAGRPAYVLQDLDLAQHIARRAALAIDNSRLYREARAAVSIRDEFLSVAAHELKTPMTSLRGYAQLLAREFDKGEVTNPERARRAAATIQVQSDKLARLVSQLLDVSRIQSGRLAIERKPTDFSELVREVVQAVRTQLKQHTLVARLPTELWMAIDPLRIEQVVTNLIDNAIKYSPEGGQIDVTLTLGEDDRNIELSVRDRGVGVPLEHRAHIFDRFYQAHAGGALTSMAGMGLGLYISRQITELHGGTIRAEFPDDGGTRMVVTLPLAQSGIEGIA
jgi:PAS domain S-box-containing protein